MCFFTNTSWLLRFRRRQRVGLSRRGLAVGGWVLVAKAAAGVRRYRLRCAACGECVELAGAAWGRLRRGEEALPCAGCAAAAAGPRRAVTAWGRKAGDSLRPAGAVMPAGVMGAGAAWPVPGR